MAIHLFFHWANHFGADLFFHWQALLFAPLLDYYVLPTLSH
jgi:hypothetical protein